MKALGLWLLVGLMACAPRLGHPRVRPADTLFQTPLETPASHPGRWYVHLDHGAHGVRTWFIDTGYAHTTCDDAFVADLGLVPKGHVTVHGEGGSVSATRVRLPDLPLGPHRVEGLRCVVRDLHSTSSIRDLPEGDIAGVLGIDVLRHLHVTFDPARGVLELGPPARLPRQGSIPLRREHGLGARRIVVLRIAGRRMPLIVDTGSTRTLLDGRRMGLEPIELRDVIVSSTGHTGPVRVPVYALPAFRLGQLHIPPGHAVMDRPRSGRRLGLLGLDLLGQACVTLDAQHHRARFVPCSGDGVGIWSAP